MLERASPYSSCLWSLTSTLFFFYVLKSTHLQDLRELNLCTITHRVISKTRIWASVWFRSPLWFHSTNYEAVNLFLLFVFLYVLQFDSCSPCLRLLCQLTSCSLASARPGWDITELQEKESRRCSSALCLGQLLNPGLRSLWFPGPAPNIPFSSFIASTWITVSASRSSSATWPCLTSLDNCMDYFPCFWYCHPPQSSLVKIFSFVYLPVFQYPSFINPTNTSIQHFSIDTLKAILHVLPNTL